MRQLLRELAGARPAGAFYQCLTVSSEPKKNGEAAARPPEEEFFQRFRPRGVADADWAGALDRAMNAGAGVKSAWYLMGFNKKDGAPAGNSDLLLHDDFTDLLDFVRWKLSSLADELAGGRIGALPYHIGSGSGGQTACAYCEFTQMCGFDRVNGKYRHIASLKKPAALEKMRGEVGA